MVLLLVFVDERVESTRIMVDVHGLLGEVLGECGLVVVLADLLLEEFVAVALITTILKNLLEGLAKRILGAAVVQSSTCLSVFPSLVFVLPNIGKSIFRISILLI